MSGQMRWEFSVLIGILGVCVGAITTYGVLLLLTWLQEVRRAQLRTHIAMARSDPEIPIPRRREILFPLFLEPETVSLPNQYPKPSPTVKDTNVTSQSRDSESSQRSKSSLASTSSAFTADVPTSLPPVDMHNKRATIWAAETTRSILCRRVSWPLPPSAPCTHILKRPRSQEAADAIRWPLIGCVRDDSCSFPEESSSDESECAGQILRNVRRERNRRKSESGADSIPSPFHRYFGRFGPRPPFPIDWYDGTEHNVSHVRLRPAHVNVHVVPSTRAFADSGPSSSLRASVKSTHPQGAEHKASFMKLTKVKTDMVSSPKLAFPNSKPPKSHQASIKSTGSRGVERSVTQRKLRAPPARAVPSPKLAFPKSKAAVSQEAIIEWVEDFGK